MSLWKTVLQEALVFAVVALVFALCFSCKAPPEEQLPPKPVEQETDLDPAPAETIKAHAALGLPDPKLYPPVPVIMVATKDGWRRPRALLEGKVTLVRKEDDGDWHFRIEDDAGHMVVCEIIPQLPLGDGKLISAHPKVGDKVYVWGIVRWDDDPGHDWGELHPCLGFRVIEKQK